MVGRVTPVRAVLLRPNSAGRGLPALPVRAVSYFFETSFRRSVEGSDNEGLPAFIEEQNLTKHTGRVKCVHPSERRPWHGVNEMIASLHRSGRHAARKRALATVDPSVGDCSHVGNRTGMASLSARKPERRAGVRPRSLRGTKSGSLKFFIFSETLPVFFLCKGTD